MSQPNPDMFYVPVRADGFFIRDNGGDVIASCTSPVLAQGLATLVNEKAGVGTSPIDTHTAGKTDG